MKTYATVVLVATVAFAGCSISVEGTDTSKDVVVVGPGDDDDDTTSVGDDDDDTTSVGDDDDDDATGDCAPAISAGADVIATLWASVNDGEEAWLCGGADFSVTGDNGRFYVESGAVLHLSGSGATVWALDGAEVDVSGADNVIVREAGASVDTNPNTEVIGCDPIVFDLSDAPSGGC